MTSYDPSSTAIIAVHLQGDVVGVDGALAPFFRAEVERTGVLDTIGRLLDGARDAGVKVVYTRVAFQPGYPDLIPNSPLLAMTLQNGSLVDGTPGAAIVDQLAPHPGDVVITHPRVTGFHSSALDVVLRDSGIGTVVFVGVATNLSVEGTARIASDMGFRTIVLADGCSAGSDAAHRASLDTLGMLAEISTAEEFLAAVSTHRAFSTRPVTQPSASGTS